MPAALLLAGLFVSVVASASAEEGAAHQEMADQDRWIDAGWALLQQDDSIPAGFDAAIAAWQQGVSQTSPQRVLLSPIGMFLSPRHALRAARRLGAPLRGIVLRGRYHGKTTYFVLSVPPAGELESFRTHFEQMLSDGKRQQHVYGWAASRFQRGGALAFPADDTERLSSSAAMKSAKGVVVRSAVSSGKILAQPELLAQKLMAMAKEAQREGDQLRAIKLLTELLKRTPEHAQARLMAGKLMIATGSYDAAWQIMRPLLKAESLDWKPWFWSGTAELLAGALNEAAGQFDEALARDGTVAEVWVHRSLVAQQRGRYKVAYQLMKVAERLSPDSAPVMLNMGFTLDALGRFESAIGYYQRYLVKTAGNSTLWKTRKVVLKRLTELGQQGKGLKQ